MTFVFQTFTEFSNAFAAANPLYKSQRDNVRDALLVSAPAPTAATPDPTTLPGFIQIAIQPRINARFSNNNIRPETPRETYWLNHWEKFNQSPFPIRGVHPMFAYNEIGQLTSDDNKSWGKVNPEIKSNVLRACRDSEKMQLLVFAQRVSLPPTPTSDVAKTVIGSNGTFLKQLTAAFNLLFVWRDGSDIVIYGTVAAAVNAAALQLSQRITQCYFEHYRKYRFLGVNNISGAYQSDKSHIQYLNSDRERSAREIILKRLDMSETEFLVPTGQVIGCDRSASIVERWVFHENAMMRCEPVC
jgi:hypothetical protein